MENILTMLTTENELMYNIVAYPLACLEFFVLLLIIKRIYNISTTPKQSIVFVLTCAILGSTARLLIPVPFNFIANFVFITLTIIVVLKKSLFKSIIAFCLFALVTAIAELIVFLILKALSFSFLIDAAHIPLYKIICCLCIYFLIILCLKIISTSKANLNISDNISSKEKFSITFSILIVIAIVSPNLLFLIMQDMQIPAYYIIYNLTTALVLFFVTTYNTHKFNKLEITKRELETANLYNSTLSKLVDMNRDFKHNISNVINSIGGYIELNDMKGLKEYYETGILLDIRKVQNLSLFNPQTINNPSVFGLLLGKLDYARNMNVEFNLTSFFDYSQINMNIFEFVKIFGILLDNAIEASSKSKEKVVDVHISIDFYNRKQNFVISNSYSNKDIDLNKIFEKDYSTKEQKSGFGLWKVKQIANNTNNVSIKTSKTNTLFTQKLQISF